MRTSFAISRKNGPLSARKRSDGNPSIGGRRSCWMYTFIGLAFILATACILIMTKTIDSAQIVELESQYFGKLRGRTDPMDTLDAMAEIRISNGKVNNKNAQPPTAITTTTAAVNLKSTSNPNINIPLQATTAFPKYTKTAEIPKSLIEKNQKRLIQQNGESAPYRKKIAFAITINKDGPFHDGAAVLAYSIIRSTANRDYDISFIAFVHPTVVTSRPMLAKLGYHVIEATTPINVSAIKFQFLREKINLNGCCGASELIKLNSYRLLQYHRIIHLDADTMILQDIDELLDREFSLIYTTDPNMATHKGQDKMPVQGGFIILKPDEKDFRNIIDTLMTTEFLIGGGWNRSKIGWFWGGMTVQGILPYYYNKVTAPGRSQIIDRCIYNTMADSDECLKRNITEIKSAHFTVCQKPWMCYKTYYNDLCKDLHMSWFKLRREAEAYFGLKETSACPGKAGGPNNYVQMDLHNAKLPYSSERGNSFPGSRCMIVPDLSLSVIDPTEESRYTTKDYDNIVGGHKNKGEKR